MKVRNATFIQITATSETCYMTNSIVPVIYALDSTGGIWVFKTKEEKWEELPDERQA